MDDFVRNKLTEWGLSEYIEIFRAQRVNERSFYILKDEGIKELIPEVGPREIFMHELGQLKVCQTPSDKVLLENRKLGLQGECSTGQPPAKRQRDSIKSEVILSDVKNRMKKIQMSLQNQDNTNLNEFLQTKIKDLDNEKRELVGVFGKTGAGKSSLINAVIEEKNLLPTGRIRACTSVMIKVEANKDTTKYEAEIEFITEKEWNNELKSMYPFPGDSAEQEKENDDDDDEEDRDIVEKLLALYGEEWKKIPLKKLLKERFTEIPQFHKSEKIFLTGGSAEHLSDQLVKYIKNDTKQGDGRKSYWPLVKCVTVKVPNNDLLQHVTIVDLPGNGDRNKSRDTKWKEIVGNCSTVWIATEFNRAETEKESWQILKSVGSHIGNGGECQRIYFICTKSDDIGDFDDHSDAEARDLILKENSKAKAGLSKEFSKLTTIKKHFSGDCLKVFTVSSKEFLKGKLLNPEDTEIPKLQDFLEKINDSKTLNYVSGAYGILSLIEGANSGEAAGKKEDVSNKLEENLRRQHDMINKAMKEAYETFNQCLTGGIKKSKDSCERDLTSFLRPKDGRGFHKTLRCVVKKGGVHRTTDGKQINLNMKLASYLMESIDDKFSDTFPNEGKRGPFNGVINTFSLDTERLIEKYKEVELQLIYLQTEEEKTKQNMNKIIIDCKKRSYSSLTEIIEETMTECYEEAAKFEGIGSLEKMGDCIVSHVKKSMDMFERAKWVMLGELKKLQAEVLETLGKTMKESIEHALNTDDQLFPDVSEDLATVKKLLDELKDNLSE